MKQYWQQTVLKVDSLSLRERIILFSLMSVVIICLFTVTVFDKQFAHIKQLSRQISQARSDIDKARDEVRQVLINYQDPDAGNRQRLKALQQELPAMRDSLIGLQKGLVSPDRMTLLLQDLIKGNVGLSLVSLKTLPVENLAMQGLTNLTVSNAKEALAAAATALVTKPEHTAAVYTHGVEIVVEGSYMEILDYINQLESMPWQLLWGKAKLEVKEYPTSTMTLTVYSLSLDRKWLNL
jgi:MSHA biogenesis protein MshJ